jgi:hypothetical protein
MRSILRADFEQSGSRQPVVHDLTGDIGQAEIASLKAMR